MTENSKDPYPRIDIMTLIDYQLGRPLTPEQTEELGAYLAAITVAKYIEQSGDYND